MGKRQEVGRSSSSSQSKEGHSRRRPEKDRSRRSHKDRRHRRKSTDRRRSSRDSSRGGSHYKENLTDLLKQVRNLLRDREDRQLNSREYSREALLVCDDDVAAESVSPAIEHFVEEQTVTQTDRGSVPDRNCGDRPINDASEPARNVLFLDPAVSEAPAPRDPLFSPEPDNLSKALFGEIQSPPASSAWNPTVLASIQSKVKYGLSDDALASLRSKYETKSDLAFLSPPKLNKELLPALTPSITKRDEYQSLSQAQVGACLNALGLGMSSFLKQEVLQVLDEETKSALSFFSEGMHLLADHHFRLSLARRAFIKPSLNILGKNAADSAILDDWLFGQNFSENLKAAQVCDKTGREISKASAALSKIPVRPQATQHRSQPHASKPQGNRRAPVRHFSARPAGGPYPKSRPHRAQSKSRPRQRR